MRGSFAALQDDNEKQTTAGATDDNEKQTTAGATDDNEKHATATALNAKVAKGERKGREGKQATAKANADSLRE
jgi:hypothetical protein